MKVVPNTGVYPANPKPNAIIDFNQKQLAAYLARARGPGESSLKIAPRPRPTGEAARVVWTLYDLPTESGRRHRHRLSDQRRHRLVARHDLQARPHHPRRRHGFRRQSLVHLQHSQPKGHRRPGRRQDRRGEVPEGEPQRRSRRQRARAGARSAGQSSGSTSIRAAAASASSIRRPRRSPSTRRRRHVAARRRGDASTSTARARSGPRRRTARCASIRRPRRSPTSSRMTYKTARGTGMTYGAAGDRDGNGWWTQMAFDIVGKGDTATRQDDGGEAAGGASRSSTAPRRSSARSTTRSTTCPSAPRCRGSRDRAAWAPTRTPTCCGSAIPGAAA